MSRPQSDPPTAWSGLNLIDVGGNIYVHVGPDAEVGGKAGDILVYHWHTPEGGTPRWQLTACGLHTIVSLDPLTLVASLGCEDGCPNHGWITDGVWRSA